MDEKTAIMRKIVQATKDSRNTSADWFTECIRVVNSAGYYGMAQNLIVLKKAIDDAELHIMLKGTKIQGNSEYVQGFMIGYNDLPNTYIPTSNMSDIVEIGRRFAHKCYPLPTNIRKSRGSMWLVNIGNDLFKMVVNNLKVEEM